MIISSLMLTRHLPLLTQNHIYLLQPTLLNPPRPTPNFTAPPQSPQPTYASILPHCTTTPHQSTSKPQNQFFREDLYSQGKVFIAGFTITVSFQPEPMTRKRSDSRTHNKLVSAPKSLSTFLALTLPAFSRYLAEISQNRTSIRPIRKFTIAAP